MIGSVVGSYKITEKIGEGGMGAVFKGIDVMLEREVAIKVLRPELARQPQIVERFRTEAVTLAKLNHPYIATLYSFLRQADDFYMVMEYVRGETLDSVIKRSGALAAEASIGLFCQALEGIEHAHRLGIIHRDIKPANMMLTEQGTIKVMDFGIARVLGADRMTRAGHLIGTIEYMSPEHVKGDEVDARSDVYSLGILLYEMLTGRVPFTSTSEYELMKCQIEQAPTPPRVFASHVPLLVEQVIMRALAKKPESRHQTAGEFRALLLGSFRGDSASLQTAGPSYAAPSTRVETPSTTGSSSVNSTGVDTPPNSLPGVGIPMETRLAKDVVPPTYVHVPVQPAQNVVAYPAQTTVAPAATTSRFGLKHYAAGAFFVLLLIAVPLVIISATSRNGTTVDQPSAVTPPASNPQPAAQPATVQSPSIPAPGPQPAVIPNPPRQEPAQPAASRAGSRRSVQPQPDRRQTTTASAPPPKPEPKQEEPQKKRKWWQKIPDVVDKVKGGTKKKQ
jgi:serine/threonine-protein kinase